MTKKRFKNVYKNPNYFNWGGAFWSQLNNKEYTPDDVSIGLSSGEQSGLNAGKIGASVLTAGAPVLGQLGNNLISGGLSTGVGNTIGGLGSSIGSAVSAVNPLLGAGISVGSQLVGGVVNAAFGSKVNKAKVAELEAENEALANVAVDDSSNESILSQWGQQNFGSSFNRGDIGKDGWFSSKAKRTYNRLKKEQDIAKRRAFSNYSNAIYSADANLDEQAFANYSAFGGPIVTNSDISNNVVRISNGGTHEESPYEGVQMGLDPQGIPNLVEENEVIYNNYVYSDRMKVPNSIKKKYKLGNKKDLTYAEAAKKVSNESNERPNDVISKNGLDWGMNVLASSQEELRRQKEMKKNEQYAKGGKLGRLFLGTGEFPNVLNGGLTPYQKATIYSTGTLGGDLYKLTNDPIYTRNMLLGNNESETEDLENSKIKNKSSYLRYAPAAVSGLMTAYNLFSDPDYSSAETLKNEAVRAGRYIPIKARTIGNYLKYNPFDTNYYLNELESQSAANRRALLNQSMGNRAVANASLLASGYNDILGIGELARKSKESDLAQLQSIENFNRGTNQYNSDAIMKAAMANQGAAASAAQRRMAGIAQSVAAREAVDNARSAALSASLNNFADNLGAMGLDEIYGEQYRKWIEHGGARYEGTEKNKKSKGGRINRKKGGLTYG